MVGGCHRIAPDPGSSARLVGHLSADDLDLGLLPAYWIENKAGNSFWHAPVPPQGVGSRLHYRAIVEREEGDRVLSTYQDTIVRPNLPDQTEAFAVLGPGRGRSGG